MKSKILFLLLIMLFLSKTTLSQIYLNKKQVEKDVSYLSKLISEVHPSNSEQKDSLIFLLKKTITNIEFPISKQDFFKKITPVFNKLRDGHSQFTPLLTKNKSNFIYFPLKLTIIEDKYFIENEIKGIKPKSELLKINNVDIDALIDSMSIYVNGESGIVKKYFLIRNNDWFSLILNLIYPKWTGLNITIKEYPNNTIAHLSLNSQYQKKAFNKTSYIFKEIKNNIGYLKINELNNSRYSKKYIDSIFNTLKNKNINNLIIDLRDCPGGNTRAGDFILRYISKTPFCQFSKVYLNNTKKAKKTYKKTWIFYTKIFPISLMFHYDDTMNKYVVSNKMNSKVYPTNNNHFKGKVYVLIGNYTYSAGISFARTIKDYKLGKIIGEETAWANQYGPAKTFILPKSRLKFSLSYLQQIRPSGNYSKRGVVPDIIKKQKITNYYNNIDSILHFTLQLITE